jgi:hypothetical protein
MSLSASSSSTGSDFKKSDIQISAKKMMSSQDRSVPERELAAEEEADDEGLTSKSESADKKRSMSKKKQG